MAGDEKENEKPLKTERTLFKKNDKKRTKQAILNMFESD